MHRLPPSEAHRDPMPDDVLAVVARAEREPARLCPVDRLPARRRNQICILVIALGMVNFLVYTLTYAALGGDAYNGHRTVVTQPDGTRQAVCIVRGHHVRNLQGLETRVSLAAWIYSYVHSITLPLTSGALIISMLILARPHILATMRGGLIGGQTFVAAFGTIVILAASAVTFLLGWTFVVALRGG